jgi:hypothetical protein
MIKGNTVTENAVVVQREPFFHYTVDVRGRIALVNYPAMIWKDTGVKLGWWDRLKVTRLLTKFFDQRDRERELALQQLR